MMVLGDFQCPGILQNCMIIGQGPSVLAVTRGGGYMDIFFSPIISLFCLSVSGDGLTLTEMLSKSC